MKKYLQTGKNRWSFGKLHKLIYDKVNKLWYMSCRSAHRPNAYGVILTEKELDAMGPDVDFDLCKLCFPHGEWN